MSSFLAYNQLTAAFASLMALSSCLASMKAQGTTGLDKVIMLVSVVALLVASGLSWKNQSPMLVGLLLCVAIVCGGAMAMAPKNYVPEDDDGNFPTATPIVYTGLGLAQ